MPHPTTSEVQKFALKLHSCNSQTSWTESLALAEDIYDKIGELTRSFELTSPPQWHNFLVTVGVREKGLCYHWSDALYEHLKRKYYPSYEFHLVGANIGEYWTEHNALLVVPKGCSVENGIIVDPWRNSGKLYISQLREDKQYTWEHRPNRGCCKTD